MLILIVMFHPLSICLLFMIAGWLSAGKELFSGLSS